MRRIRDQVNTLTNIKHEKIYGRESVRSIEFQKRLRVSASQNRLVKTVFLWKGETAGLDRHSVGLWERCMLCYCTFVGWLQIEHGILSNIFLFCRNGALLGEDWTEEWNLGKDHFYYSSLARIWERMIEFSWRVGHMFHSALLAS